MKATQVKQPAPREMSTDIKPQPCLECGKTISAPYGRWRNGWSCSKKCELIIERKGVTHASAHRRER